MLRAQDLYSITQPYLSVFLQLFCRGPMSALGAQLCPHGPRACFYVVSNSALMAKQ